MHLARIDWIIIAISIVISFLPALFFAKRAGSSTAEFFTSGRAAPWWLIGISMVATTFSTDTPNLVTNMVRENGVADNWLWWSFLLTGMATVFFYAQLWRRSKVLTDLEFYEIRYSGKAATMLRGFRAVYLGLLFNCVIMATVNLAAAKIANIVLGWPMGRTLLVCSVITIFFASVSGLWGVLVTDSIQFMITLTGSFATAYFALSHPAVGGLAGLIRQIPANTLNLLPDFGDWSVALAVFIIPITVQWWSVWYPGAEPGGGSYIAQRMLAARSEQDAVSGTLLFNIMHYALRPWPWILVALASTLVYPHLSRHRVHLPVRGPEAHRERHGVSRHAALPAGGVPGADARRDAGGLPLDDRDPPQLGHLVPGARLLPPLPQHRRDREALRAGGTDHDGAADDLRGVARPSRSTPPRGPSS